MDYLMSYQYGYASEKFSRAIYTLATGKGDIRSRLLSAFQRELLGIRLEHLSVRLHRDYQWILTKLTKYDEKYEGQIK